MIRAFDIWLPAWFGRHARQEPFHEGERHMLIAVCDHFEPFHGVGPAEAMRRVETWHRELPRLATDFAGSDGIGPRHTFFYPVEQYDPAILSELADLCHATGSETEVHLHHENDTTENLQRTLEEAKERLAGHGLLCHDDSGAVRFGFVHGNWALDDSHPAGRHCGVRHELAVLRRSGCYADFTLPSAPERTQTRTINEIYYARATPRPKSHDRGRRVQTASASAVDDELLIIQGPLGLNWQRRKLGLFPRLENSDLTAANPPTVERMKLWLDCRISVLGQPNWIFVKLHTHGAKPENTRALLGEPMRRFHRGLADWAARDERLRFHYVTAREMANLVHAAEDGHTGDPASFRDYKYRRIGAARTATHPAESGR